MIAQAAFHIGRLFGYETSLTRDGPLFDSKVKLVDWERHDGGYFHLWCFGYELTSCPNGQGGVGFPPFINGLLRRRDNDREALGRTAERLARPEECD